MVVYFSGDWDVHWGYGILTHSHVLRREVCQLNGAMPRILTPVKLKTSRFLSTGRCISFGRLFKANNQTQTRHTQIVD